VLGNYAQTIASWYPNDADKAGYVNAAANLRLPYWDWAAVPPAGESILPASVQTPTVNVSGPNGVQEISHPLYSYTFRPLNGSVFIEPPVGFEVPMVECQTLIRSRKWSLYPETVRAPTPENAQAQSNNTLVAITLDASAQSFRSRLYNLFTNTPGYGQFADQAWTNSSGSYDSIEALHDTIHTLTGLQGHMAYIPFSAFDPIFFLHHAMVDRAFAMWQMINPGSWIPPTPAAMNSYTTSMGQIQDSQSSLTPFYSGSNGSFWNSDGLRDTSVFAYTYPEFTGVGGSNGRAQVVRAINRLYGASSPANLARKHGASKSRTGRELSDSDTAQTSGRPRRQEGGGDSSISDAAINRIVTNNQYREWVANIRVDKQALNQSYIIQLRLDESPQDSGSFAQEAQLIGAMGVFAAPPSLRSGKPMHLTSGTIPLTSVLVDNVERGNLQDLEVPSAKPFLVDRLQIRVRLVDGSNIEPTSVHGLSVSIVSARVKVPNSDDSLPIWGRTVHHFDLV
jgi:tyrosinase